jgi:hypothetical protein
VRFLTLNEAGSREGFHVLVHYEAREAGSE